MIDNVTAIQVAHSPALGEKAKAQKGSSWLKSNIVLYKVLLNKNTSKESF